jgi:hypothetical protein
MNSFPVLYREMLKVDHAKLFREEIKRRRLS